MVLATESDHQAVLLVLVVPDSPTVRVDAGIAGRGVSDRVVVLASAHHGLTDYVLSGPYTDATLTTFEGIVTRVGALIPEVPDHPQAVALNTRRRCRSRGFSSRSSPRSPRSAPDPSRAAASRAALGASPTRS
jgi:hypothetical protein